MTKPIDFTQNLDQLTAGPELSIETLVESRLDDYPDPQIIIDHIAKNEKSVHVYSDDIRIDGVLKCDAMDTYLATQTHLSSGNFKKALISPMHFKYDRDEAWKEEVRKHKDISHFDLGNFLHECILEPTKFSRVVVEPSESRASHEGLNKLIEFWTGQIHKEIETSENDGEAMLSNFKNVTNLHAAVFHDSPTTKVKKAYLVDLKALSQFACIQEADKIVVDTVHANYLAYAGGILPRLVKHSKREVSMYATDADTGLNVRIRPDAIQFAENIGLDAILSIKSTRHDDVQAFARQCCNLNYDLSEGMYQKVATQVTGRPFRTTLMIIVQTVAPYGVALAIWNPYDIEVGLAKYEQASRLITAALTENDYPGFEVQADNQIGMISFKLPNYAARKVATV